jgi:thiamine biosynthesis lipoprotein
MKKMFSQKDKKRRGGPVRSPANLYPAFRALFALYALLILYPALLISCSHISVQTETFYVMNTFAQSTIISASDYIGREINENIKEIIAEIEERISRTLETSEIYKLNELNEDAYASLSALSGETAELLQLAETVKEATNGAFNPNLGEIIDLWGFNDKDDDESIERTLPQRNEFFAALERLKSDSYVTEYDLGAIGKGYALDHVNDYLESEKMQNALVSLGGSSILALGRNKNGELWQIGIKDPVNPALMSGIVYATDKFVSVSAGYERYITIGGINYIHIIDPETGYPVDNDLLCVVVITEAKSVSISEQRRAGLENNGALSDALSTALYVMGRDKALEFYKNSPFDFEMILYYKSGSNPRGYEILQTNLNFSEVE